MAFGSSNTAVGIAFQGKDELSPVVRGIRNSMDGFKRDAATGFGLGAGISVFNAAKNAIGGVVDFLGDAVKASMVEEESISRLTAAIKANDAGWNGNMDAIEAVIDARKDMAFADDEQRTSLARLVSVTKDSTTALDLQRTAMDLARLRGMDLATASDLIGKVYGGNIGILSRYGIQLEKGTTSTEALAEIQKRATGQAEAYANTTQGKLARAQIAMDDAMEELGATLTPIVADFASMAADVIPDVVSAFNDLRRFLDPASAAIEDQDKWLRKMATDAGMSAEGVLKFANETRAADKAAQEAAASEADLAANIEQLRSDLLRAGLSQEEVNRQVAEYEGVMRGTIKVVEESTSVIDEHEAVASGLITLYRVLPPEVRAAYEQLSATDPVLDGAETVDEAADSITASVEAIKTGIGTLGPSIKERIDASREGVKEAMMNLRWAMENPFAEEKFAQWLAGQADKAMRMLAQAIKEGRPSVVAEAIATRNAVWDEMNLIDPGSGTQDAMRRRRREMEGRAVGGPVMAGQSYLVGERGPEVLTMGSSGGYVTPNHQLGGGGGNVYLDGYLVGRIIDERLGRQYGLAARARYRRAN